MARCRRIPEYSRALNRLTSCGSQAITSEFRVIRVLLCLTIAVLIASALQAQTGSFGFDGRIVVPDPHFDYPPIEIRLLNDDFDGRTIAYEYTEGKGSYAFKGL